MPIYLRKYYINKLIETRKEENKQSQKSQMPHERFQKS